MSRPGAGIEGLQHIRAGRATGAMHCAKRPTCPRPCFVRADGLSGPPRSVDRRQDRIRPVAGLAGCQDLPFEAAQGRVAFAGQHIVLLEQQDGTGLAPVTVAISSTARNPP